MHLGASAEKASVLIQELRTCITFRRHQTLYLSMILQEDRKGLGHLFQDTFLSLQATFLFLFLLSVALIFISSIHVSPLNFLFPSLSLSIRWAHRPAPRAGSWLYIRDIRAQKGKLRIVVVRAATRGSAQWDSGCLWLALITDSQTHQALVLVQREHRMGLDRKTRD